MNISKFCASCLIVAIAPIPGTLLAQQETPSSAQHGVVELRYQLEQQRELIRQQQLSLEQSVQQLDALSRRLAALEETSAASDETLIASTPRRQLDDYQRDSVGDLNADSVRSGAFPGSMLIPGEDGVSLRIGGYLKAVAIHDSGAENAGAAFLPAYLGTAGDDIDGAFGIDANLSRIQFDARSSTGIGDLRGYLEFDLNERNDGSPAYRTRLAYGSWRSTAGTLTAGHTWSTLMDLKVLPVGLTEPTVSGAVFQRQPLLRWSQAVSDRWSLDLALEDPSGSDVLTGQSSFVARTSLPDVVGAIEHAESDGRAHLRLGIIYRKLTIDTGLESDVSEDAWGFSLSGHRNVLEKDKLMFMANYGEGLGRYLVGLQSGSGGSIDPLDNDLKLRTGYGGFVGYQHFWRDKLHSSAVFGRASSERLDIEPLDSFEGSSFFLLNLMWQVLPQLTFGMEYNYGVRENADGSDLDSHRVMFGVQIY